ncbi:hypothetical protein IAT38_005277 [Cryptococcus sp. DSM 104549]
MATGVPFPQKDESAPPVLPLPRQPSPIDFAAVSATPTATTPDNVSSPSPAPALDAPFGHDGSVYPNASASASSTRLDSPAAGSGGDVSGATPRASAPGDTSATPSAPASTTSQELTPIASSSAAFPTPIPQRGGPATLLPITPLPDSLLLKHTLSALDHSASTLKRHAKNILAHAAVVHTLSEQLEKAEDDMFRELGELGRWLEGGYGVQTSEEGKAKGVWEDDGVRKVNRDKRRREREELQVQVVDGLRDVKAELKRKGLAGGAAQAKYETCAKHFYHHTSVYLSPQPGASTSHNQQPSASSTYSASTIQPASDMAQALRHATWDLERYNYHSTLLWAVPPSSKTCLDLLVGLYGWAGGLLGEIPGGDASAGIRKPTPVERKPSANATRHPHTQTHPRTVSPPPTTLSLKNTLSSCLAQLAQTRVELLQAWAVRDDQASALQEEEARRRAELEGGWGEETRGVDGLGMGALGDGVSGFSGAGSGAGGGGFGSGNAMASVTKEGVEYKKAKKHRLHRSVGGRLRDFLSPSGSSYSLAPSVSSSASTTSADREKPSRASFDSSIRPDAPYIVPLKGEPPQGRKSPTVGGVERMPTHKEEEGGRLSTPQAGSRSTSASSVPSATGAVRPSLPHASSSLTSASSGVSTNAHSAAGGQGSMGPPPPPPKDTTTTPSTTPVARPNLSSRHSALMPGGDYISPFLSSSGGGAYPTIGFESSPDLRLDIPSAERTRHSIDSVRPTLTLSPTSGSIVDLGLGRPSVNFGAAGAGAGVGGVGGLGAGGDEDERREEAGRKKEGVLWGLGTWEGLTKGSGGKGKWEKFWVVLDHSSIYEYRDNAGRPGIPGSAHAVIDLKFASVREGRGTDRRFVFEIVTPSHGRRLYQATSVQEMKLWLYAICNAIESCINGTSTVRTFPRAPSASSSYDDHFLPVRSKAASALGLGSRGIGMMGLSGLGSGGRRSMPPTPTAEGSPGFGSGEGSSARDEPRTRKTSLKKVLKQSGERFTNAMSGSSSSTAATPLAISERDKRNSFGGLELPRPAFGKSNRQSMPAPPHLPVLPPISAASAPSAGHSGAVGEKPYVLDDIANRVHEMAGLGLGAASGPGGESPGSAKRRVKSEAVRKYRPAGAGSAAGASGGSGAGEGGHGGHGGGEGMARSRSDDGGGAGVLGMGVPEGGEGATGETVRWNRELRRIAGMPENGRCADCGAGMRASRWATYSLHNTPIVLFLCIRCVGIHRSLGTHISKTRSVDMDNWAPELVECAREWGNERGNSVWEARRGADLREVGRPGAGGGAGAGAGEEVEPGKKGWEEDMRGFVKAKYEEGRWLSEEDRRRFGLGPAREG